MVSPLPSLSAPLAVAFSVTLPLLLTMAAVSTPPVRSPPGTGNGGAIAHGAGRGREGDQIDGIHGGQRTGRVSGAGADAQIENLRNHDRKIHVGGRAGSSGRGPRLNVRFGKCHERKRHCPGAQQALQGESKSSLSASCAVRYSHAILGDSLSGTLNQVAIRPVGAQVPPAAADIPWFLCAGSHGRRGRAPGRPNCRRLSGAQAAG